MKRQIGCWLVSLALTTSACGGGAEDAASRRAAASGGPEGGTAAQARASSGGSSDFMGRAAPAWVEQLPESGDRVERAKAVAALTSIGPGEDGVVEALIGATADEDALVRTGASRPLGDFELQVAPALIGALANDPDPAVRAGVAPILGNWAGDAAVNAALADVVRNDADTTVRTAAARGLSVAGPAAAAGVPALIDALNDESADVRQWAAVALGRVGPAPASVADGDAVLAPIRAAVEHPRFRINEDRLIPTH